mmetsp:Transcript_24959/g.50639  ORF Transcript_24959/g.50639 Transcript_24959/m.50639 type:complete len:250 (+) Transcript_24959:115-864(+)
MCRTCRGEETSGGRRWRACVLSRGMCRCTVTRRGRLGKSRSTRRCRQPTPTTRSTPSSNLSSSTSPAETRPATPPSLSAEQGLSPRASFSTHCQTSLPSGRRALWRQEPRRPSETRGRWRRRRTRCRTCSITAPRSKHGTRTATRPSSATCRCWFSSTQWQTASQPSSPSTSTPRALRASSASPPPPPRSAQPTSSMSGRRHPPARSCTASTLSSTPRSSLPPPRWSRPTSRKCFQPTPPTLPAMDPRR